MGSDYLAGGSTSRGPFGVHHNLGGHVSAVNRGRGVGYRYLVDDFYGLRCGYCDTIYSKNERVNGVRQKMDVDFLLVRRRRGEAVEM